MKKLFSFISVAMLGMSLLASCAESDNSAEIEEEEETTEFTVTYEDPDYYTRFKGKGISINVYNWGDYISAGADEGTIDVNGEFEKLTGIKVNYTNFATNEELYAKLKGGAASYDVIIPSDYMIERMISEGLLQKLDFNNIPNYKYIADRYKNLPYDPENAYSVPYAAGMVGIIYNTKMVEGTPDSWSIMWDENYSGKILQFRNSRDAFLTAQVLIADQKGVELDTYVNTNDTALLDEAAAKLEEQRPLVQSYVMDEIFNKMKNGSAAVAPYYTGDYLSMKDVNDDLSIVYPKEGTNLFVDAACIPTCARNKEAAELYINFLLEPDVALEIAEFLYYQTPHTAVLENDEYSLKDNKEIYPDNMDEIKTVTYRHQSSETLDYVGKLWDDVRQSGNNYTTIFICFAVAIVVIVVAVIVSKQQKKKRNNYD